MKYSDLQKWSGEAAKWADEYFSNLDDQPVRSQVKPGDIKALLPENPPENPEDMEMIFKDFREIIPPGITHWQHPRFFAYFVSNASPASIIAEQLVNYMATNSMLWQTSPAATELEERMIEWFGHAFGLQSGYSGLIQDTASSATLAAVLTMREKALNWEGLDRGLRHSPQLRIYASKENHSSIEKAVKLSGIGFDNLRFPNNLPNRSIDPEHLRYLILEDIDAGYQPAGLVLCVGGTATGAIDNLVEPIHIAREFDLYTHVDAAWAGSAMVCPEFRHLWKGVEGADSIVVNPHKWLGMQLECTIHFLADPILQSKTVGLRPDYLRTRGEDRISNLSELAIVLGRRFRALKVWFTIRAYGLSGLRELIRNHVKWTRELEKKFRSDNEFEMAFSSPLALFGFRFNPPGMDSEMVTNRLFERINDDGRIYLTQAKIDGKTTIRFTCGTYSTTREDVLMAYDVVRELGDRIKHEMNDEPFSQD